MPSQPDFPVQNPAPSNCVDSLLTHNRTTRTIPPTFPASPPVGLDFFRERVSGGKDAVSSGLDGAVFESGMPCAGAVATCAEHHAGSMQQLRTSSAKCAAAAGAAVPDAAAFVDDLPAPTSAIAPGVCWRAC